MSLSLARLQRESVSEDFPAETESAPLLESFSDSSRTPFETWSQSRLSSFERIVVRQIDIRLMPILCLIYVLNFLDRHNIASARLANLEEDLGLTVKQYDACVSILYVGYISMQVHSNVILSRVARPAYYLCGCMAVWGFLSACTAFTHNFTGLLLCRFLLGFVESAFYPGALVSLSIDA